MDVSMQMSVGELNQLNSAEGSFCAHRTRVKIQWAVTYRHPLHRGLWNPPFSSWKWRVCHFLFLLSCITVTLTRICWKHQPNICISVGINLFTCEIFSTQLVLKNDRMAIYPAEVLKEKLANLLRHAFPAASLGFLYLFYIYYFKRGGYRHLSQEHNHTDTNHTTYASVLACIPHHTPSTFIICLLQFSPTLLQTVISPSHRSRCEQHVLFSNSTVRGCSSLSAAGQVHLNPHWSFCSPLYLLPRVITWRADTAMLHSRSLCRSSSPDQSSVWHVTQTCYFSPSPSKLIYTNPY